MSELRILVVATQIEIPGTGGGQTHVSELVSHLRQHGEVLALTRRDSKGEGVVGAGFWKGLPPKGLAHAFSAINLARSLARVRQFGPNVIYERGSSFGLGAMYSHLLDVPMLTMLLDQHMSPVSLARARQVITTEPELVPKAYRSKAVKVSWGANTQRFHPGIDATAARARWNLSDNDFVIGYCGTFRSWHGLDLLVDLAGSVGELPMKFLLIGDHERAVSLRRLIAARGLESRFVLTGQVPYDQVPAALSAADVCVAPFDPTRHKGAGVEGGYTLDPLKLFEYLALEKPVVTINSSNIAKLFDDGQHLRMVPPRDVQAFRQALLSIYNDPQQAKQMAARGRARVQERHTWTAHARHLAELFHQMLASG